MPAMPAQTAKELAVAVEAIVRDMQPLRVYVFGSHARGDATEDSDVDLLLVMPESVDGAEHLEQKAYELAEERTFSMDVVAMPADEFQRRSAARASLPSIVLREGKLLYAA